MKRIIWQATIMALLVVRLAAQPSLEFFTNQANALLLPQFGFGVANIPIYSSTNPAAYSASLHYLLQSAANAYDATTPATNSPSVFRPLFAWSSNTLFIVGYTNVTTDFYAQIAREFKVLTDPTISSNDNVWGIPWVVGAKGNPPAFNEYCYATAVIAQRKLLFIRFGTEEDPVTNLPPRYTNQFFIMSISNVFGVDAWNYNRSNFPDGVTLVASNQVTISVTNNYNGGTNFAFSTATNWIVNSWPGWAGGPSDVSFLVPMFTNVISLPPSYWSESTEQFIAVDFTNPASPYLPSDLQQMGWPVHNWTLNITNNFTYGLIDNRTGLVLDFVNLGGFGSSLPITRLLAAEQGGLGLTNNDALAWSTNGATDAPNSPMSSGVLEQILIGQQESTIFSNALVGAQPSVPGPIFGAAFDPIDEIKQNCTWSSINSLVHYTLQDLTGPDNQVVGVSPGSLFVPVEIPIPNLFGAVNSGYNSGAVENASLSLTPETFQLDFSGVDDLPYTIWASTNLLDWSQIGTASQPAAGTFQFDDPAATNYPARFYQVRLP
jgi:hypothetical protein